METPIYDATKSGFENIEKKISDIDSQVNKKINDALKSGRKYTKKEVEDLKQFFKNQIDSLKQMFEKEQANQTSKLEKIQKKIEPIKNLLSILQSPPSIDTIVSWAKSAASLYTLQYEETVGRAVDVTKTITYVGTEVPKITTKITKLPNILDKIDSIPIK